MGAPAGHDHGTSPTPLFAPHLLATIAGPTGKIDALEELDAMTGKDIPITIQLPSKIIRFTLLRRELLRKAFDKRDQARPRWTGQRECQNDR